jgi:hypothetical protein
MVERSDKERQRIGKEGTRTPIPRLSVLFDFTTLFDL